MELSFFGLLGKEILGRFALSLESFQERENNLLDCISIFTELFSFPHACSGLHFWVLHCIAWSLSCSVFPPSTYLSASVVPLYEWVWTSIESFDTLIAYTPLSRLGPVLPTGMMGVFWFLHTYIYIAFFWVFATVAWHSRESPLLSSDRWAAFHHVLCSIPPPREGLLYKPQSPFPLLTHTPLIT